MLQILVRFKNVECLDYETYIKNITCKSTPLRNAMGRILYIFPLYKKITSMFVSTVNPGI
jgi:hypothetical protein